MGSMLEIDQQINKSKLFYIERNELVKRAQIIDLLVYNYLEELIRNTVNSELVTLFIPLLLIK